MGTDGPMGPMTMARWEPDGLEVPRIFHNIVYVCFLGHAQKDARRKNMKLGGTTVPPQGKDESKRRIKRRIITHKDESNGPQKDESKRRMEKDESTRRIKRRRIKKDESKDESKQDAGV